jgi:hypothetical protein
MAVVIKVVATLGRAYRRVAVLALSTNRVESGRSWPKSPVTGRKGLKRA